MRYLKPFLAATTLLLYLPQHGNAQTIVGADPGDRVRVRTASSENGPVEGIFQHVEEGALFFFPVGQAGPAEIPLDQVESMETFAGTKRQTLKGLGIGAGSGAALGIVLGFADGADRNCSWVCFSAEEKAVMGGVVLGITGGVIGLIAGALTKTDHWREVPVVGVRPAFRVNRAGKVDLGISFPTRR